MMTETQRWKEIDSMLQRAFDLTPPERETLLAGVRDEELRREIEALLAADERANGFLAEPVLRQKVAGESPSVGQRIGAYQIIGEIGRGGMGMVYLAAAPRWLRCQVSRRNAPQSATRQPPARRARNTSCHIDSRSGRNAG